MKLPCAVTLLAILATALSHTYKDGKPSSSFTGSVSGSYSGSYSSSRDGGGSYSGSWSHGSGSGHNHHQGSWGQWPPWHSSPPPPTAKSTPGAPTWDTKPPPGPQGPEGSPSRSGYNPAYDTDRIGGAADALPPSPNSVAAVACREGDKVYRVGDKWTALSGCGRSSCVDGKITTLGCPTPEVSADCVLSAVNPLSPWPACCPQLTCQH